VFTNTRRPPGESFNRFSPKGRTHFRTKTSTQAKERGCFLDSSIFAKGDLPARLKAAETAVLACLEDYRERADLRERYPDRKTDPHYARSDPLAFLSFRNVLQYFDGQLTQALKSKHYHAADAADMRATSVRARAALADFRTWAMTPSKGGAPGPSSTRPLTPVKFHLPPGP
jgi:hypothetical protein